MPAKPKSDLGPPRPTKIGGKTAYISEPKKTTPNIKITIDTAAAENGAIKIREMFDRIRDRIMAIFIDWLQSPDGQEAIKKAIREELKR